MTDRLYDVVTFDCYGTLVDWEGGLATAFMRAGWADGVRLDRAAVIRAYMAAEREVEAGAYRRYREVLAESARRVAARLGWRLDPGRAGFLADSLPAWVPFPDTNAALERLSAAGYALGILSNVDNDLLAATQRHLTVKVAHVVTAEQVGAYKPAPPHFSAARRAVDGRRWLHVGQGYFHDIVPARTQSIPNAWINRNGDTPDDGGRADREFPTLRELADWLAPTP
ncbi:MAG TPA: HAD-IA family hydrolase [Methylomirabilota bacterium]|jgi:2-haloalkanoic acid dehalogenase type II|nr:HAD-IA family hydrolase [Methylomirabilota bacterium]